MARRDSNVEILYQDLLQRFSETRKLNMKLLEEKRELLLRMQSDKSSELRPHSRAQHDCENDIEFSVMDLSDTGSMGDASERSHSCYCDSVAKAKKLSELNFKIEERYNLLKNDYDKLESDFLKLREENKEDRAENSKLRNLIEKLSSDLQNSKHTRGNQAKDSYNFEDIEALKQQLIAYKEDFDQERKDKEKSQCCKDELEVRLKDANSKLSKLSLENMQYKQCLSQVKQQKEHLLSEMRRLSTSSLPFSPVLECNLPMTDRFNRAFQEYQDVIPRSSGPNIRTISPSAFKGAPASEDLGACS